LQLVLRKVEDSDDLIFLDFRFAADIAVLGVENCFSVASVTHPVVHDEPQNSHLGIISLVEVEISSDDLGHGSLSLLAVPQYSIAEGGLVRPCVSEHVVFGEIGDMILS
jgi:hypothetical protein